MPLSQLYPVRYGLRLHVLYAPGKQHTYAHRIGLYTWTTSTALAQIPTPTTASSPAPAPAPIPNPERSQTKDAQSSQDKAMHEAVASDKLRREHEVYAVAHYAFGHSNNVVE